MSDGSQVVKALVFDVFGTVVDWHGSVAREVRGLAKAKGLRLNAAKFAKAWRAGYRPAMDRVRSGEAPFRKIDDIHRTILDEVLAKSKVTALAEEEKAHLNLVWHRLKPWPDSVRGLKRLKSKFIIAHALQRQHRAPRGHGEVRRAAVGLHLFLRYLQALQARPGDVPGRGRHAEPRAAGGDDGRRAQAGPARRGAVRAEDGFREAAARAWAEQQHGPRVGARLHGERGELSRPGGSARLCEESGRHGARCRRPNRSAAAQPVDRAVARHERRGLAIADQCQSSMRGHNPRDRVPPGQFMSRTASLRCARLRPSPPSSPTPRPGPPPPGRPRCRSRSRCRR